MAGDGLQGRADLRRGVLAATQKMRRDVKVKVMTDAWDISAKGGEAATYTIMNTPSAIKAGKEDRIMTGQMIGAIDALASQQGNITTARAGWLDRKRDYFTIQDQGGTGTGAFAGIYITPMHALRDAKLAMAQEAKRRGYEIQ